MSETRKLDNAGLSKRSDLWWLSPLIILLGLIFGVGYLVFAALQNAHYIWGPYISPVYVSPYIPSWWKISPAFLLLWIPAGFRMSCYYGRKMYYRSIFADPANCAVDEPYRKKYSGESKFPFVLMNVHRYFLYFALMLTGIHWYEFFAALVYDGGLYLGVGTLILFVDTVALSLYVFSCHYLRHLIGGKKRSFSCGGNCSGATYTGWKWISLINQFHGRWFWISLFSIAAADIYIRLLSMGIIGYDPHILIQ